MQYPESLRESLIIVMVIYNVILRRESLSTQKAGLSSIAIHRTTHAIVFRTVVVNRSLSALLQLPVFMKIFKCDQWRI